MGIYRGPLLLRIRETRDRTDPGGKTAVSVLSHDPELNTGPFKDNILLIVAHFVAQTKTDLFADQVRLPAVDIADPGRYIIFYLNSGIYLKQVGLPVTGDDPLPGPDIVVTDMGCQLQRVGDYLFEDILRIKIVIVTTDIKAGRRLQPLLPAGGLDGAVPGAWHSSAPAGRPGENARYDRPLQSPCRRHPPLPSPGWRDF